MIMLVDINNYKFTVDTATWLAVPVEDGEDDYAALRNHYLASRKVRLDPEMIRTVKRITKSGSVPVSYMRSIYGGMPWDRAFSDRWCHATGYEFCMADMPEEWWNEYVDDGGNYHYGR